MTAGPEPPRAAWGARSALPALPRGAGRPSPSSRASRRVPSRRVPPAGCRCESVAAGTFSDSWSLYRLPFPPRRGAGRYPGPSMQNVINTVKGKALEVAEYLTPVLKVSRAGLSVTRSNSAGTGLRGSPRVLPRGRVQEGSRSGTQEEGPPPPVVLRVCSRGLSGCRADVERRSGRTPVAPSPPGCSASGSVGVEGGPRPISKKVKSPFR